MINLAITDHAFERAKERAGWNRSTLSRMVERVFFDGVATSTPCRKIREFLCHYQQEDNKNVDCLRRIRPNDIPGLHTLNREILVL